MVVADLKTIVEELNGSLKDLLNGLFPIAADFGTVLKGLVVRVAIWLTASRTASALCNGMCGFVQCVKATEKVVEISGGPWNMDTAPSNEFDDFRLTECRA